MTLAQLHIIGVGGRRLQGDGKRSGGRQQGSAGDLMALAALAKKGTRG